MTPRIPIDFQASQDNGTDENFLDRLGKEPFPADPFRLLTAVAGPEFRRGDDADHSFPQEKTALYLPDHYERNYPYPLILWLHNSGGNERELHSLMPQISTRNYVGYSFRGALPVGNALPIGYRWPESDLGIERFLQRLHNGVRSLRRKYHIHSERIYLAGCGQGATFALRLLLEQPAWFAGAIALCGRYPKKKLLLKRYDQLRDKRVLLGVSRQDSSLDIAELQGFSRLLYTAGMHVSTRSYVASGKLTSEMLKQINRWIMESICSAV